MLSLGQLVFSKRGRDNGTAYLIVKADVDYLFLSDGKLHKVEKPKKKKLKHVQTTNFIDDDIKQKLCNNQKVFDNEVSYTIRTYMDRNR